jgi:protein-disulfide isomerase
MSRFSLAALLLCGALTASGCADTASADGTNDLSRTLLNQPADDGQSTLIGGEPGAGDDGGPRVQVSDVGVNRGSVDALVKVVEMSDYGCGYCRQFHMDSFAALREEFIETGMVEWKFVPYITGMFDNSLAATEAAECAYVQDVAAFERLNRRIWDEQGAWKGSSEPATVVRAWATDLGIDMAAFDSCLESDQQIPRIAAATTLARQLGVRGTPTFVVLGYPPLQGALPLDTFREILTMVHAEATAAAQGARP